MVRIVVPILHGRVIREAVCAGHGEGGAGDAVIEVNAGPLGWGSRSGTGLRQWHNRGHSYSCTRQACSRQSARPKPDRWRSNTATMEPFRRGAALHVCRLRLERSELGGQGGPQVFSRVGGEQVRPVGHVGPCGPFRAQEGAFLALVCSRSLVVQSVLVHDPSGGAISFALA
jgi:hypothetical protein